MARQPNVQNIANAFQTLATEIASLPNLPVVNITQQIQNLQQIMVNQEQRTQARISNSTIRDDHVNIEPLLTDTGVIPPNFPQDLEDIKNARANTINGLLTAYNQPVAGNLETRKKRLAKYLGIRLVSL
ncbi:7418_t:CDS:2 [Funneliformis caledonium]|uniref:7418_t:CDS:1 n=1 Tax=Funneliformis caledonium TaxID=1117310 RepID=A0A9N9N9F7_9GLOM|nr:7418_t:CDS:2 [Funneliformis caledonium]